MPYNNTAIPPPEEITGTSTLPLARVKKIIATDDDISQCSNTAAFAISVATEIFIRYLTEQAHNVAKSERKPRRNIQYKDFANAVARIDNLDFLADVIPKTTTYRQFKEKKAKEDANAAADNAGGTAAGPGASGQTTFTPGSGNADARSGRITSFLEDPHEMNGVLPSNPTQTTMPVLGGSPAANRTLQAPAHGHPAWQPDGHSGVPPDGHARGRDEQMHG